jgi:hypothetical protein
MASKALGGGMVPLEGARWSALSTLGAAVPQLPMRTLLHAGPPIVGSPSAPVRNAAAQALVFEGAAADLAATSALVDEGAYRLAPAQDFGVATPLAQVVSPKMPVFVVGDGQERGVAPLIEGPPPALRFGATEPACLDRLRTTAALADKLAPFVETRPIAVERIVAQALGRGDECHARVGEANAALVAELDGADPSAVDAIAANPGFVLPLLMAASVWKLRATGAAIEAVGGNGDAFGIRLADRGWITVPASPPSGSRFPGAENAIALGAIGDSAVIDFCGLGGQALAHAPTLLSEWAAVLPPDAVERPSLLDPATRIVDARRVRQLQMAPIVDLAMLDRAGTAGLIGRGAFMVPLELFASMDLDA